MISIQINTIDGNIVFIENKLPERKLKMYLNNVIRRHFTSSDLIFDFITNKWAEGNDEIYTSALSPSIKMFLMKRSNSSTSFYSANGVRHLDKFTNKRTNIHITVPSRIKSRSRQAKAVIINLRERKVDYSNMYDLSTITYEELLNYRRYKVLYQSIVDNFNTVLNFNFHDIRNTAIIDQDQIHLPR